MGGRWLILLLFLSELATSKRMEHGAEKQRSYIVMWKPPTWWAGQLLGTSSLHYRLTEWMRAKQLLLPVSAVMLFGIGVNGTPIRSWGER